MILIGQYDSPFVRRVAITLLYYRLPFEHRPWSVWGNADEIARYNPLRRVPTLILDEDSALVDSFAIVDYLDELAPRERLLLPSSGKPRRDGLRVAALSAGVADKAVTLLYASLDLTQPSQRWTERCRAQVLETLSLLEVERSARATPFWFGADPSHADLGFACAYRFTWDALPGLIDARQLPALAAQAARCEALPEFQQVYLPITNHLAKD